MLLEHGAQAQCPGVALDFDYDFVFLVPFFWDPLYVFVFVFVPTQKSRHLIAPAAGELYATRVHRTVEEETTHLENRQMPKI